MSPVRDEAVFVRRFERIMEEGRPGERNEFFFYFLWWIWFRTSKILKKKRENSHVNKIREI